MRLRRILSLHLSSSSFFALGAVLPVISYSIAYYTGNSVSEALVEFFSWALLACHVLPEIIIDLNTFPKAKRKLPHMRYGTGPCTNFVQSMLFAASCIFQGIFFANTWSDKNYNNKSAEELEAFEFLNLIAGHMWLLCGLIAMCSVGTTIPICRKSDEHAGFWEKIANDFFVLSTLTLCIAGYVMVYTRPAAHMMHIIVRGMWCALGSFYFVNDLVEEYVYRGGSRSGNEDLRKRQKAPLVEDDMP